MITRQEIVNTIIDVAESLRPTNYIPNPATRYKPGGSTGNMAFHAYSYVVVGDEMQVYIDQRIAPYVFYTNEPWISSYWNGKKNPNEGWWQRFVGEFVKRLAAELGGEIE